MKIAGFEHYSFNCAGLLAEIIGPEDLASIDTPADGCGGIGQSERLHVVAQVGFVQKVYAAVADQCVSGIPGGCVIH